MSNFKERYESYYCDKVTSRGIKYRLLVIEPSVQKPTILFLHGFPSSSHDWHHQIEYFHKKGYGLIVPDLLGYGGTDKPTDPAAYKIKLMADDIADLLDSISWVAQTRVVSVSHDWGSGLNSRVMLYHQERFVAFVFICVGGLSLLDKKVDYDVILPFLKQTFGSDVIGYQEFFTYTPDAAELIERNMDSFIDFALPTQPEDWLQTASPRGATEAWLRSNKRAPRGAWLTEEDSRHWKEVLLAGGMTGPLNWYRSFLPGLSIEDDNELRKKNIKIVQPLHYIEATRDALCPAAIHLPLAKEFATNVTQSSIEAGHWVQLEKPDELNGELEAFFEKVT